MKISVKNICRIMCTLSALCLFYSSFALNHAHADKVVDVKPKKLHTSPSSLFAEHMTTSIVFSAASFDEASNEYIKAPDITISDIENWQIFANQISHLKELPVDHDISSFGKQDFVIVKELDKDGQIIRETIFTPNIIQLNYTKAKFHERIRNVKNIYYDFLEMQMEFASFGSQVKKTVTPEQEGIIINYRISDIIENPIWRITEPDKIKKILNTLNTEYDDFSKLSYEVKQHSIRINSYLTKKKDFFKIHLNLGIDGPPSKAIIDDKGILTIHEESKTKFMFDQQGYYNFFLDYYNQLITAQSATE